MTDTLSFKEKVFRLQNSIRGIQKDKTNPHFKYKYISAQNVNEVVKDALEELRLIARQVTELVEFQDRVVVAETKIELIDLDSDESMFFSSIGSGTDTSDKHAMKAATASAKYATVAMIFGASKDDPEAVVNPGDVQVEQKPASVRSNRPATALPAPVVPPPVPADTPGAAAMQQGPVDMGGGVFAVTVQPGEVYDGRPTKSGKTGPGTVLGTNGVRYDTFDTGLLDTAKKAKAEGKLVNVMYVVDAKWNRNKIVEHGLGVFGEVAEEPAEAENY